MSDNRGPQMVACAAVFLVLMYSTVAARCYVRIKIIRSFALDDWLAVVVLALMTGYAIIIFAAVAEGCGRHEVVLSTKQKVNIMKYWYAGEISYIISTAMARIAVAAFLLRVAVKSIHRWIVYIGVAINLIFSLYFLFFTIFQCSPIQGFWTKYRDPKGIKCHSSMSVASTFAASAIGAVIDWVFGVLPVAILWPTTLDLRKKIVLGAVMGLGAIASTAPLVRIPYTISLEHSHDFIYETIDVSIWSFSEPALMLTAISLAVLRPLFSSLKNRSNSSGFGTKATSNYQDGDNSKAKPKQSWQDDDFNAAAATWQGLAAGHHTVTIEGGYKPAAPSKSQRPGPWDGKGMSTMAVDELELGLSEQEYSSREKILPKR